MAGDRCGGGGLSSGTGRGMETHAVRGSRRRGTRPPSASPGAPREQSSTRVPGGGFAPKGGRSVRLSVNSAAYRTRTHNDGAERSASSKRYLFKELRTSSGAPRPFPRPSQREREAETPRVNTCPHLTASRSVRPRRGRIPAAPFFPLRGRSAEGAEGASALAPTLPPLIPAKAGTQAEVQQEAETDPTAQPNPKASLDPRFRGDERI